MSPSSRAPLLLALLAAAGCSRRPEGPNILLITLDTTRRDHLGFYGYDRPTSPNLDRLAAESVVYTNAYATSSWTMPTHASMFTGKFPSAHGATYDPDGPLHLDSAIGGPFGHYRARPIAENETTLAMLLTEHGYATGGVAGGPWMKRVFRLDKGFEFYDDENVTELNGRPAEDVTRVAIDFVDRHADAPFFLFLNYYDPHSPWADEAARRPYHDVAPVIPPGLDPSKLTNAQSATLLYDSEIRYMDEHIGRLLDHLRQTGRYEDTWIFVLADHGELIDDPVLGEPGLWGHTNSLTQAEIHIPFLVKEPGGRPGTADAFVQQVDILPTIVARLGLTLPPNVQGVPLGRSGGHPIVAELDKLPMMDKEGGPKARDWRHKGDWRVLVEGANKFGWSSNGTNFLVDLAQDPLERVNRIEDDRALAAELDRRLATYIAHLPKPGELGEVKPIDDETLRAIQGLGYAAEGEKPPPGASDPGAPPESDESAAPKH